jgi:DNA-binding response OmpR family regulator
VIVLANTVEDNEATVRAAGLLRKPFSLAEMIDEVRRVLRATSPA